jgi:hypothetical protein
MGKLYPTTQDIFFFTGIFNDQRVISTYFGGRGCKIGLVDN